MVKYTLSVRTSERMMKSVVAAAANNNDDDRPITMEKVEEKQIPFSKCIQTD